MIEVLIHGKDLHFLRNPISFSLNLLLTANKIIGLKSKYDKLLN